MRWQSSKVPVHRERAHVVAPARELLFLASAKRARAGTARRRRPMGGGGMPRRPRRPCRPRWRPGSSTLRGSARGMRSSDAARNRAPKSLKAAVGPWNSSSTDSGPGAPATSTSGAGKLNASRVIAGSCADNASPSANGAMQAARDFRQRVGAGEDLAIELQATARARTGRHPVRARARSPRCSPTTCSAARCSGYRISRSPHARLRGRTVDIQLSDSSSCAAKAATMASRTFSASPCSGTRRTSSGRRRRSSSRARPGRAPPA